MLHLEKRKNSEERRCSPLFQIDHRTSSCIIVSHICFLRGSC
jgi:hypothetical protein